MCTYFGAATTAVFVSILCPESKMWRNNNGTVNKECLAALLIVYLLVLVSFFAVYGSDPGYITKEDTMRLSQQHHDDRLQVVRMHNPSNNTVSSPEEEVEESSNEQELVSLGGYYTSEWRSKFCDTCHLSQPLRSHHCRQCNRCVATFDHHCSFIGTCIGERNHCRFYCFLTCQTLGFILCVSVVNSSSVVVQSNIVFLSVFAAKLYLYPLTFISILLWISHSWFALSNMTSFECGKGSRHIDYLRGTQLCDLPFHRGLYANLVLFCCQRDDAAASWQRRQSQMNWTPILWRPPSETMSIRNSNSIWNHPLLRNKYYSCC